MVVRKRSYAYFYIERFSKNSLKIGLLLSKFVRIFCLPTKCFIL